MDESEGEAAERRSLRCIWVTGGRALTEQEAAVEIVNEARLLLQEDLAQLGVQWDPATLPTGAPALNNHHEEQMDNIKDHQQGVKTSESRDTDRGGKENKTEYKHEKRMKMEKTEREAKREQGKSKSEDGVVNIKLDRKEDKTEAAIKQAGNDVHMKRCKEPKKHGTNKTLLIANDKEDTDEKGEKEKQTGSKQEGEKSKGFVSIRPQSHHTNHPVPERNLTQELAEIASSPLPQLMPLPQPSSSPMPPPRFRAPISRAEKQHSVSTGTSKGDGTTGLVASPVQPGRLKLSKALSKVLHSIQTDRNLQDNTQIAQVLHSKPTGVFSAQDLAPAGQVPATLHAPESVYEKPTSVSAPSNADMHSSPLSVSPASVPLVSPEAKRRRIDGREVDTFSSPELYAGDERDEDVDRAVKKGGESFGDSFELDTQTERVIAQETSQHRDGNDRGINQLVETEKLREEEMVVAAVELDKDTDEGSNPFEAPDVGCPRFNISLTDSQMELILSTSQQVSDLNHADCKHFKMTINK